MLVTGGYTGEFTLSSYYGRKLFFSSGNNVPVRKYSARIDAVMPRILNPAEMEERKESDV